MVHMQYRGAATPPNTCAVVNMKDTFLIILSASTIDHESSQHMHMNIIGSVVWTVILVTSTS